jgi:hypothetical protein
MIIGIGYKARSGKGEVAKRLVENHGFVEVAFADKLKQVCMLIFGLTHEQCYGDDKDKVDPFWNDTPRNILQKIGEGIRKAYREDVWVKAVEKKLEDSPDREHVISDCRYPNECKMIHEHNGYLVRIDRPGESRIATSTHASETALDTWKDWEGIIVNDGSLADLACKVDEMVTFARLRNPANLDKSLEGPAGSWRPTTPADSALAATILFGKGRT